MRQVTKDKVIISFPRFFIWRVPVRELRLSLMGCPVYFYTKTRTDKLMRDAGFKEHTVHKIGKLHGVIGYIPKTTNKPRPINLHKPLLRN